MSTGLIMYPLVIDNKNIGVVCAERRKGNIIYILSESWTRQAQDRRR